jgi:hypothetical protein
MEMVAEVEGEVAEKVGAKVKEEIVLYVDVHQD